ncbi:MAG: NAD(P)-binding domain-containing protein, partial [Myxococcales bacterium]
MAVKEEPALPATGEGRRPEQTIVGFIGIGKMGRPMSERLLAAGFSLHVHNRSRGPV